MKIGFFDSGLGGLTILSAVRKLLPQYDYVYFGDTKNLPYGDKSEEDIFELTRRGVEKLFDGGALLVVVACNTASAASVRKLQDTILRNVYPDRKLLGVIIPTIETLVDEPKVTRALLIGTERTVRSGKYEIELAKKKSVLTLVAQATPTLVPKIESGDIEGAYQDVDDVIRSYSTHIDAVILGCTHYTLLKDHIRKNFPGKVISQDEIIPQKLQTYLHRHPEIEGRLTKEGSVEVVLSAEMPLYEKMKKEIFKHIQ